ncbi:MAG: TetR/AcrR family transcriptional regulator [Polyangiaceae bacterium]
MARPRSDIAPRIVHAARARFLHDGVDGASLRKIAEEAGTSIGMVYYYFPTKDDLFLAVVEETYAVILQKIAAAIEGGAGTEDRLLRLYRVIGTLDETEATTVRLVVREALVSSDRLKRVIDRFERGHLMMIAQVLQEGMMEGRIDTRLSFPVLFGATVAIGVVPQIMRRFAAGRLPPGPMKEGHTMEDELLDVLFHGIGPRADKPAETTPAETTPAETTPVETKGGSAAPEKKRRRKG